MRKNPYIEIELFKNSDNGVKFHVKQFDDLRINAKIYDGTEEVDISNQNITVFVLKEDKTIIEQKNDILVEDNTLKIKFSKQATTAMGKCQLEVILKDEDGSSATSTISYMVNEKLSASISEIIKSEDDIDSLDMIEEFIQTSNVDILEIKEAIQDIKDNYETVLESKKDEILDLLSNVESEIVARIESKGEEIVEVANTTMEKAQEAIEAIDEALEDIDNIQNVIDVALMDIETAKDGALEEIETIKTASTEEISELKDTALEDISALRDNAIGDISDLKDESINDISNLKDTALEEIGTLKDKSIEDITELKDNSISDINTAKDNALEEISTIKDESIEEMNIVKAEVLEGLEGAIDEINTVKDGALEDLNGAISEINTAKVEAIEEIVETKDSSIEALKEEEAGIIERISEIEISGTAGVDEAVKQAQKRLQELTIQSTWEVSQEAVVQAQGLQGVANEEKVLIRDVADGYKESVRTEGQRIVEMVENLDADIEQGLTDINRTITEGRADIITNANNQVSRIRQEGQEIIEAVENLEAITDNHIENIDKAGLNARQSIESKANSELGTINSISSIRRQEINELAENKLEAIENSSSDKIAEIEGILGVTKGEAEDLLEQAREELNTGKAQISSSINEGLTTISNIKTQSASEMRNLKNDLYDELLGAEVELKGDIEKDLLALRNEYTEDISELGNSKVESLQNMIETIDNLEESIVKNLENSQERAENIRENFDSIFESTDNKMAEIRPILNDLSEMRALCNDLLAENAEANENVEELDFLHVESDTRIVELRLLIQEAKQYENVLIDYIESRGGGHEEIEARLEALEESIIALDDAINTLEEAIENIDLSHLATKEELQQAKDETLEILEDYATKEDLEKIKPEGMNIIGKFITGTGNFYIPENMKNAVLPDSYADKEVKHTMIHKQRVGTSDRYFKTFFFVDLDDVENKKHVYVNNTSYIRLYNLNLGTDYIQLYSNSDTATPSLYSNSNSSTYTSSIDAYSQYTFIYDYDFDMYNQDGSEIVFKSLRTKEEGYGDFDDAIKDGYYLIDMDLSSFTTILNAPKITQTSKVKGFLEVLNGVQTLRLQDGQVFSREISGVWGSILDNAVKNTSIATIGASSATTPELFKNFREYTRRITNMDTRTIIFKQNSTTYTKMILEVPTGADVKAYLQVSSSSLALNIVGASRSQIERYTPSTGKFELTENASGSSIFIAIKDSEIYATDFPIYLDNAYTRLYKDITPVNYSGGTIMSNMNDAVEVGIYSVEASGDVLNAPAQVINGMLEVAKSSNGDIYQVLKTNDNVSEYSRVYSKGKWSIWNKISDDFIGKVGTATKYAVDKNGIFNDLPSPPSMTGVEYMGKIMYSSGTLYRCIYLYRPLLDGITEPFVYVSTSTTNGCEAITYEGKNFTALNSVMYYKNAGDTTWGETYGWSSFQDVYNTYICDNTVPIYVDANKSSVYREARTSDKITNLDACNQAGKYLVNITKEEYKEISNLPDIKIDKDLDTILYTTVEGNKVMQEITIDGITYTRTVGSQWIGLSNKYVKTDIVDYISGVEVVDNEEAIEALNIEEIYATCPYQDSHKEPNGTIDFKDSSGRYYRWRCYGKGSGFYRTTNNYIGVYANSYLYTERYAYNNGIWVLNTGTSASSLYVAVGSSGEILACDIDVVGGSSYNSIDKTVIVRKADIKDVLISKNDFNDCTKEGCYKVNIEENKEALNAPVAGVLSGTLEVIKIDNIIKQVLTTKDNVFIRTFNKEWNEWFSSKAEEAEEIGKVEISPKYNWDVVPDKTIYSNLSVPSNCKSIWAGKLNGYFIVAFFNREIEMEVIKANDKEYMKVRDYKYADVIGSYYYNTSARGWTKEGESSCNHYYNGNTSSNYSLTATFYNNYVMYNTDGTIYKPSYLEKDNIVLGIEDFNNAIELNTYTVKQENEVIANSPTETSFEGILEIVKTDNIIKQALTTSEDVLYTRVRNNEEWTEWKNRG